MDEEVEVKVKVAMVVMKWGRLWILMVTDHHLHHRLHSVPMIVVKTKWNASKPDSDRLPHISRAMMVERRVTE